MERILPRGQLICEIHASPLFGTYEGLATDTLPVRLVNRIKGVRVGAFEMSHSVQVCFFIMSITAFLTMSEETVK